MKKYFSSVFSLVLMAALLMGCGEARTPSAAPVSTAKKISVISTIFPSYDFARAVAGDKAEVTMLLPPASESHSFEPTPADILKIQKCDVFIYVGGESDKWVETVLSSMDTSKIKIITLMDCVEPVEEKLVEGMQEEEEQEEKDTTSGAKTPAESEAEVEYDEHVWTSPRNAKQIVQKISDALQQIDSQNAKVYESNTAAELAALDTLDAKFKEVVGAGARKTIVFGDRFPFRYFADAYGLTYFAAFPGCSTDTEASAATVKFLVDKVKDEKIPVIFHIELSNQKMAKAIAESTGAKVLELHACHNISKEDFKNGKTYVELMNANVAALKEALK